MRRALPGVVVTGCLAVALGASGAAIAAPTASDAGTWSQYTIDETNASLNAVYASGPSDAWAVGRQNPEPTETTWIQHFDGASWQRVAGPDLGTARDITGTSASDIWISGRKGTAHYDGHHWTIVPLADGTSTTWKEMYEPAPGNVWAIAKNRQDEQLLEHFDGAAWSVVDLPAIDGTDLSLDAVFGSGPNDIWVTHDGSGILHGDGTTFTSIAFPDGYTDQRIVAVSPTDAWAGINNGQHASLAHWDGNTWTGIDESTPSSGKEYQLLGSTGTGAPLAARYTIVAQGYAALDGLVTRGGGSWQLLPPVTDDGIPEPTGRDYAPAPGGGFWALGSVSGTGTYTTQSLNLYHEN